MSNDPATDIFIYAEGPVYLSICAPVTMPRADVEARANQKRPTGVKSKWTIADEKFRNGDDNPRPCEVFSETRVHYLLWC